MTNLKGSLVFAIPVIGVVATVLLLRACDNSYGLAPSDTHPTLPTSKLEASTLPPEFQPGDDYEPLPPPGPNDWLAVHHEPGQSYDRFVRSSPNTPTDERGVIHLQPLNRFDGKAHPSLPDLRQFAASYFGMPVVLGDPLTLGDEISSRIEPYSQNRQYLTGDILDLLKRSLPANAFCVLGITMDDIYPGPRWNFVFGQASLRERVAVYSFARYDPEFYGDSSRNRAHLILRRSCKVLAHETAHMFGITHCIECRCLMNGSNHLAETDATPMRLCPTDLRKLQWSVGFDLRERYRTLATNYDHLGFKDEARWVRNRLRNID